MPYVINRKTKDKKLCYMAERVHDALISIEQESPALASIARDDSPASSTAAIARRSIRDKVGSEFET